MRHNHQRGFTLIEVLIAAGIAVTILTGIILITNTSFRQTSGSVEATSAQTNLQAVQRSLTQDLRAAEPHTSTGHTGGNPCAYIATATHWISYCNTPTGANRAEALRATPDPRSSGTPVNSSGTNLTAETGSIRISKSDTQFLTTIKLNANTPETQLAITTRIGGN